MENKTNTQTGQAVESAGEKTTAELIRCFESAIEQLEEIRSGDIDQEGNLYYLLHDWSRKGYGNEGYNDSLEHMWDVVRDAYKVGN